MPDYKDMGIPPSNFAYDPAAVNDVTDGSDLTEFWDEGWTLEDEWHPAPSTMSTVHRPIPQPVRLTEVIALL